MSKLASPYLRIVEFFDKDETAGSFLREDGEGGFVGGIYRMAREIDRLRALSQPQAGEPVGYQQLKDGKWEECSEFVAKGWSNELSPGTRAIYASPQPALAVKGLEWSEHPNAFPAPAWSAHTGFGFYHIEEVSASDSPAYEVRLHAHHLISVKDDLEAAKAAAQADYETRIRSALVASPPPSGAVEAFEAGKEAALMAFDKLLYAPRRNGTQTQHFRKTIKNPYATAALPVTPATADEWRTMDSAPKDGTQVLLYAALWEMSWGIQIGHFEGDGEGCGQWVTGEGVVEENDLGFDPDEDGDDDDFDDEINVGPTHWMPLPAAPTATGGR